MCFLLRRFSLRVLVGVRMPKFPRPCTDCGRLTSGGNLCDVHQRALDSVIDAKKRERKIQSGQYSGSYKRRAAVVRASAVVCHLCGEGFRLDDPWQADHVVAGDPNSVLLPAHRSCNASRGNRPL